MKENQHIQSIPSAVFTKPQTKIDEAKALFTPYLLALTQAERQSLPKIDEKTIAFTVARDHRRHGDDRRKRGVSSRAGVLSASQAGGIPGHPRRESHL
ncbi:MAG: hypothetical protein LBG43_09770 [Treponema sp.]|nr:hypothetical protein [Treponema sp.]